MKKILLIEDHPVVTYALKLVFKADSNIEIVGIANSGRTGLELVDTYRPDLVILDLLLPDIRGDEVAQRIKDLYPDIHIVIYSGEDLHPYIGRLLDIKVSGWMNKSDDPEKLKMLVDWVFKGMTLIPISTLHDLHFPDPNYSEEFVGPNLYDLNKRELDILYLASKNYKTQEIANQLKFAEKTVEGYFTSIYKKMNLDKEHSRRIKAVEQFKEHYAKHM